MNEKAKPKDVDAYIAAAPKEARATLDEVRKTIRSAVPKAEESISWGVPFYKYHGLLGGFSVYKDHVSFGPAVSLSDEHRKALEQKGYKTGKKTVQIGFDQKVPVTVMKQILKAQATENEAKQRG